MADTWSKQPTQFLGRTWLLFCQVTLLRGVYRVSLLRPSVFGAIPVDRTNLIIPGAVLNTFDRDNDHIAEIMRPILDTIWNALNYGFSPSYDEFGKYKSFF